MNCWPRISARKRLDGNYQPAPRPGRQPQPVDVRFREIGQHLERDLVFVNTQGTWRSRVAPATPGCRSRDPPHA